MIAAWQVTGEPKKKVAEAAVDQKVDPEMLERWIKFLAKPPKHYSYLRDWQDMVKCGGTLEQAQFLADNFQNLVLSVAREEAELKEENDIIKAKAGVRKKPRRDSYPNEFETERSILPGLRSGTENDADRASESVPGRVPGRPGFGERSRPDPGLLSLRDWALERHFSAETAEHVATLRAEIEALKKAQVALSVSARRQRHEDHSRDARQRARQSAHAWATRCRNVFFRSCRRPIPSRFQKAAAVWSWPTRLQPARSRRG